MLAHHSLLPISGAQPDRRDKAKIIPIVFFMIIPVLRWFDFVEFIIYKSTLGIVSVFAIFVVLIDLP